MFGRTELPTLLVLMVAANLVWCTAVAYADAVGEGLVSYWPLDESTIEDGNVEDVVGDNDGKIKGNPKIVAGVVHEALFFPGADDYVEVPSNESLQLTEEFTIETRVKGDSKPQGLHGAYQWLTKGKTGANFAFNWHHPNGDWQQSIVFQVSKFEWISLRIEQPDPLEGGEWYHIVGVWDGKNLRIYLDGELSNEAEVDGTPQVDDVPLGIGGGSEAPFQGTVDEVRIYNRALTRKEIQSNFEDMSPKWAVPGATRKLPTLWGEMKRGS